MSDFDPLAFLHVLRNDPRKPQTVAKPRSVDGGVDGDSDVVTIADPEQYVSAAIERECREVEEAPEGTRNPRLNSAAFSLGRLLYAEPPFGDDVIDHDCLVSRLYHAAEKCGLVEDDGAYSVRRTIQSGLAGGARKAMAWTQQATAAKATPLVIVGGTESMLIPGRERTSWWPRDTSALEHGDADDEPLPIFLRRDDGVALLYAGKVNALIGESESGKTWVALEALRQAIIDDGVPVAMIDFEDSVSGVWHRLVSMGVPAEHLGRSFRYVQPDEPLSDTARADIGEMLATHRPALVVVDGVNAAMTLLGLDLKDNRDVTTFSQQVLRPLAKTGAAVVTIDHVTKNKETRGSYAIGAQAKRADVDGAALIISVAEPFGRGMTGKLRAHVSKDRPGHVRGAALEGKYAGTVTVASTTDPETVSITVEAPSGSRGMATPFRPTTLMERASLYLEGVGGDGEVPSTVKRGFKGDNNGKGAALEALLREGYIGHVGTSNRLRSLRPFRDGAAERSAPSAASESDLSAICQTDDQSQPSDLSVCPPLGADADTSEVDPHGGRPW